MIWSPILRPKCHIHLLRRCRSWAWGEIPGRKTMNPNPRSARPRKRFRPRKNRQWAYLWIQKSQGIYERRLGSTTFRLERQINDVKKEEELHMRNELVPLFFPEQLFKMIKKSRSFLVGHAREGIIWIFAFQIDYQFCEFVRFSKLSDGIRKSFPADNCGKIAMGFTMAWRSREFSSV